MNEDEKVVPKINTGTTARFECNEDVKIVGVIEGRDEATGDWLVSSTAEFVSPLQFPGWEESQVRELLSWSWKDLMVEAVGRGIVGRSVVGSLVGGRTGLCAMIMLNEAENTEPLMVPREQPVQVLVKDIDVKSVWVMMDELQDEILKGIARHG